ncbi:putative HD superfamily hydrolase of NAD metabolism [Leptolyngbyaceae cyanobacterium JSC-12]|nr:putative HD superfamily hydrolase of NAD metabolism [Leptolyngbyaceae cyanobacterium JSC-12]
MRESLRPLDSNFANDAKHQQPPCEPGNRIETLKTKVGLLVNHQPYRREKVLDWLNQNVPEKRLQHILRVEEMAVKLAQHHQLDAERAAQAGLMHDLAKCFKPKQLLRLASENGLEIDSVLAANPHLLHADVGAIVARDEFGIDDVTVLEAISNHTLGSPGMSDLSCVVFLADTLEPGRGDTHDLQTLREVCWHDLHRAVWLTSEYTLKHLFESHSLIHPRALMTRNWAMQRAIASPKQP